MRKNCDFLIYNYNVQEGGLVNGIISSLQDLPKYSMLKYSQVQSVGYKQLLEIDSKLGTTQSEQLRRCLCFFYLERTLSRFELIFDFLKFKIFQKINIDQVDLDELREDDYVGYADNA